MKFGIYLRNQETYPKMLKTALKAEKLGFTGAYLNDHVIGFANEGKEDYLEAWTVMAGIGVQTSKIKVGQIVLFNSLRNPAFLAKSVATLDQMTNGRFDLLIGSGWNKQEYVGYDIMEGGRGMPSVKERVDRFEESVKILNFMLKQKITDFDGDFWKLKGAINLPQPVQNPFPLTIGCMGPRMMGITARYASGINLSTRTVSDTLEHISKFKQIHEKISSQENVITSLDDFIISGFSGVRLAENENQLNEMLTTMAEQMEKPKEEVRAEYLVGTPDDIITKLRLFKDAGMVMNVIAPVLHEKISQEPLEYFKDNIMTQL